jgi:hypothetical protein
MLHSDSINANELILWGGTGGTGRQVGRDPSIDAFAVAFNLFRSM